MALPLFLSAQNPFEKYWASCLFYINTFFSEINCFFKGFWTFFNEFISSIIFCDALVDWYFDEKACGFTLRLLNGLEENLTNVSPVFNRSLANTFVYLWICSLFYIFSLSIEDKIMLSLSLYSSISGIWCRSILFLEKAITVF